MTECGVTIRGPVWDAAVKLYAGSGEVEKADAVLEEGIGRRRGRPHAVSFLKVLGGYARKGDVHNAEKIFLPMRTTGYVMQRGAYMTLLNTYVNAKVPAYGFDVRLKRDSIVLDGKMARLLAASTKARDREADTEWLLL